jgi:hypothetical protein
MHSACEEACGQLAAAPETSLQEFLIHPMRLICNHMEIRPPCKHLQAFIGSPRRRSTAAMSRFSAPGRRVGNPFFD